jgi:hypothetical protein
VAFPKRPDLLFSSQWTALGFRDSRALVVAQDINARSPRLDLPRELGKLFSILLRPGSYALQHSVDLLPGHLTAPIQLHLKL